MMLAIALAAGQILVATEKSHDPDLAKTVVLLIQSDSGGVMGIILNRPPFGGPIPMGKRALLREKSPGATQILPGIYLGIKGVHMFNGYVGWSERQLTDEISRGLWKVRAGDASIVFDRHPETLWRRLSP